jgi:arsenate reductase-like glutaredoxin family protein
MSKKKITIYIDEYSYFSEKLRQWLKSRHFEFEEKDVKFPENAKALFDVSGQHAVPVAVIGKEVILGFNEPALEKSLGGKGKRRNLSD